MTTPHDPERGHAKVRPAPVMDEDDEAARLRANFRDALHAQVRAQNLLRAVLDAGRPHRFHSKGIDCACAKCLAWDAVAKELRGE